MSEIFILEITLSVQCFRSATKSWPCRRQSCQFTHICIILFYTNTEFRQRKTTKHKLDSQYELKRKLWVSQAYFTPKFQLMYQNRFNYILISGKQYLTLATFITFSVLKKVPGTFSLILKLVLSQRRVRKSSDNFKCRA